eukprot:COSAG01_NODE_2505_length_7553_cov_11.744030_9_plen_192_part_00
MLAPSTERGVNFLCPTGSKLYGSLNSWFRVAEAVDNAPTRARGSSVFLLSWKSKKTKGNYLILGNIGTTLHTKLGFAISVSVSMHASFGLLLSTRSASANKHFETVNDDAAMSQTSCVYENANQAHICQWTTRFDLPDLPRLRRGDPRGFLGDCNHIENQGCQRQWRHFAEAYSKTVSLATGAHSRQTHRG